MAGRDIALLSDNLLFASQLNAALRRVGGSVAMVVGDGVPAVDSVFVDLNADVERRLEIIGRLRQGDPDQQIVGFCHHAAKQVRIRAMERGADQVVTNGALQAVALRLAGDLGNV